MRHDQSHMSETRQSQIGETSQCAPCGNGTVGNPGPVVTPQGPGASRPIHRRVGVRSTVLVELFRQHVYPPLAGHPTQLVLAAICEAQARADHQVLDRA
jgi:hypothetical protein